MTRAPAPGADEREKRLKALRLGTTLYLVAGAVWLISALIPVVMDRVRLGTWGEPNLIFLALAPIWIALAWVNIGILKKAKAEEQGGDVSR